MSDKTNKQKKTDEQKKKDSTSSKKDDIFSYDVKKLSDEIDILEKEQLEKSKKKEMIKKRLIYQVYHFLYIIIEKKENKLCMMKFLLSMKTENTLYYLSRGIYLFRPTEKVKSKMFGDMDIVELSTFIISNNLYFLVQNPSQNQYQSTITDENATVLFSCPNDGLKVVEKFIIYRLRFDGIACSRYSVKNNTNYQLSLEIVNVKEHYKNNPKMMCLGLLFRKDDFSAVKDYLHRVMVLGLNGVWIKTKEGNEEKWYHWKWFIGSIPCDTVAQEQLIGEPNKKLTNNPILYCDGRKLRYCFVYNSVQPIPDGDLPLPYQKYR